MQRQRGALKKEYRRPFWLPASNYYFIVAAATLAVFSLVWGIFYDGGVDTPLFQASLAASVMLLAGLVVREVILRSARNRYLATQRLERNLAGLRRHREQRDRSKITLERNAALLREISKKSEAAKVLGKFAEGHREVFELCEEYISAVNRELPTVGVGSPRIAALRKGSSVAEGFHHFHLLQWAEIESRSLTAEARNRGKITEKLASAREALGVIEFALRSYPHEADLLDSQAALQRLVSNLAVSGMVEKAERAAFKKNYKRAIGLFNEALFQIEREGSGEDAQFAAARIREEIARLQETNNNAAPAGNLRNNE